MDVPERAGVLALAELYTLYPTRLAGNPAGPASRPQSHGLSFTRRVLNEMGSFRDDVRIGEDTLVTYFLQSTGIAVWFDPSIMARHVPPANFRTFLRDQYVRGRWESRWDVMRGGFPKRWFDSVPWPGYGVLGVLARATSRFVARARWIVPSAWRATRGQRWQLVASMPAMFVGLLARQWGWMAEQRRSLRRPSAG